MTGRTSAPSACIRSTFGCWRSMSSAPMYTTHGSPSSAQAVAVATPCWPAPVSAMTRVLPRRRVSSAWPERVVDLVGAGVGDVLALQVQAQGRRDGGAGGRGPRPARGPARRGGRRGRGASGGRRTSRAARAAPPRSAGRGGARRTPPRAGRARPSASRARTGRRTPRSRPQRPRSSASSRPASTGVGPVGEVRAVDAGGAGALGEQRDLQRVLARPLARAARAPSTPEATSTPTAADVRSASPTDRRVEAAGEDDRRPRGRPRRRGRDRRAGPCRPDAARRRCRGGSARRRRSRNAGRGR